MANLDESLKKLRALTTKRPDGMTNDEWREVISGAKKLKELRDKPFDPKEHKALTQSDLAKMFIRYYFWFLAGLLLFTLAYNVIMKSLDISDFISIKDTFMMVASTITPILAFVLGHYFKGKD
jgi:hypothetical protein